MRRLVALLAILLAMPALSEARAGQGLAQAFESGRLQLFQLLFARGRNNAVPRTREYQYSKTLTSPTDLFVAE